MARPPPVCPAWATAAPHSTRQKSRTHFAQAPDHAFYLKKLKLACEPHTRVIHAYVLMTNHVHLLMTPTSQEGMGKVIQGPGRFTVFANI